MASEPETNNQTPEQDSGAAPAAATETPITINAIQLEIVDSILSQQGEAKAWALREHLAFLRKLAVKYGMPEDKAKLFKAVLAENGAGGNASQFRQWLAEKQNRLPAAKKRNLDDYE